MHNYRLVALLAISAVLALAAPAVAEQRLTEIDAVPFGLAVHRWIPLEVLDHTSQAGYRLAAALPANVVSMVVLKLAWPRSDELCYLGVAQLGDMPGYQQAAPASALAMMVGDGDPHSLVLPGSAGGVLNRLCIWPTARGPDAELVFLLSMAEQVANPPVYGVSLSAQGDLRMLDVNGAQTILGWFDAVDLDEDGTYELLTSKNLDGTWGGFFYHTVRSYNQQSGSYVIDPDRYRDYFQRELAWLNWVVETRAKIQQDPEPYLNQAGIGYNYVADYQGRSYGFDSVIELPATAGGVEDLEQYNRERRKSFELVFTYRDELAAWLDGGPYPPSWKLAS